MSRATLERAARDEFHSMDSNGDGRISAKELVMAKRATDHTAGLMIRRADVNGDGKLSLEELVRELIPT